MTYCLAIRTREGLVFASDSRTNAGVDQISVYSKLHGYCWPGERSFVLLSAGNLATTQLVVKRLREDAENPESVSLRSVSSMDAAVDYVGGVSTQIQRYQAERDTANTNFEATFIFGGQIAGGDTALNLIYPQGNYIHEPTQHPFLQIGETKYGKPILDRSISADTPLPLAARCAVVSINSTIRSNLTVGPPIDLLVYGKDSLAEGQRLRLEETDPLYHEISQSWAEGLQRALCSLPRFPWESEAPMPGCPGVPPETPPEVNAPFMDADAERDASVMPWGMMQGRWRP